MKAVAFDKLSPVLTGAVALRLNTPAPYLLVGDSFLTKMGGERGACGRSESNETEVTCASFVTNTKSLYIARYMTF